MTTETLKDLTILYAEDDEAIKNNTIITLELVNATVISASDGQEGFEKFKENQNKVDIILTDISMPNMDGLEMIEEIRKIRDDIPVLVTTAHQDISYLKKAIELGVTSYILKPIDIRNIIKSIVKAMEPITLKEELIKKNKELIELNNSLEEKIKERTMELERVASTDYLTGINNRRNFFKLAKEKFENNNSNLYAVMIDLDDFKQVNDTYGHKVGDEVLILTTKAIKENLNDEDIFGRIGGEEFAVLFTNDNEEHLDKVEKMREIVQNIKYEDVNFTISLGIAQKLPSDKNIDMLLSRADEALYEAKGSGRNKLIFRER